MHFQNRLVILIYRCLLVLACGYGLYLNIWPRGAFFAQSLIFYTILSNTACLIFFLIAVVATGKQLAEQGIKGPAIICPRFKGAITMMIALTMLGFHFLILRGGVNLGVFANPFNPFNMFPHYIAPLMVILDWALFDARGRFRWFDPLWWLALPTLYLVFALVRAQSGVMIRLVNSLYPYHFIDIDRLGWGGLCSNVLMIAVMCAGIGYLMLGVDRVLFYLGKGR